MSIRILLADDHELFREGLKALIGQLPDMEVVAEVSDGRAAMQAAVAERPDVLVMDVAMPGMNGIEATRRITEGLPHVKVMCLSMHHDRGIVLAALEAGASGYLIKECAFDELATALRSLARGRTYLSPAIAGTVVEAYRSDRATQSPNPSKLLTGREREVLQLIAEGHSTRAIAERLHVSAKTVSSHREHIMNKLQVKSVAALTKYAIREGLTSTCV